MTFDAHTWFNRVLDNPGAFGFTDVTGYRDGLHLDP